MIGEVSALRPLLAAAGLGLGIATVREPGPRPAGPAEAAAAASMPARRRLEFLAGRRAARRALRAVGLDCGEIPRSGRLPVFPPGRTASISHSAGIAVAVARAAGPDLPLGCDLELRPLPRAAARLVLREDEEELLDDRDEPFRAGSRPTGAGWTVTELFSAKEAAWKALASTSTGTGTGTGTGPACLGEALDAPNGDRRDGPNGDRLNGPEYGRLGEAQDPDATESQIPREEGPQGLRHARSAGSLRDLRVGPAEDGMCVVRLRADPARAVRVRVVRVRTGVFGYVLGPSPSLDTSAALG
ncbi:enterobactin synthetase [Streptomyces mutabilis]|uniref:enterobactin synthetase n=1 Tax=Streptomyces mutabilis TaxID=67332 RepID=UPI00369075B4